MILKPIVRKSSNSSKERVLQTLNHSEPDQIPFDLGETRISGIHEAAYRRYREKLGLPQKPVRLQIKYLQLPEIDEDFRKLLGVDIESVDPDTTPFESDTRKHKKGYVYTDMWGSEWLMPHGGHYFDLHTFPLNSSIVEAIMDRILEHKLAFYRRTIEIMKNAQVDYYIICESDDLGGHDGRFFFTPVHSLQHDVPFENFLAMVETFREYVF